MSASPAWPEGVGRIVLDEVDSTNAEAARIAPGLAGPAWILGLRQTAGHGRRGRAWSTPRGNFAATLVMRPAETPDRVALRSFVASLALHDTFLALTGLPGAFALKWPNDVLCHGGKIAGILLESSGQGGRVGHIAIGIGVNLATAPEAALVEAAATPPVTLAGVCGTVVTPQAFLDVLAPAYAAREAQFASQGFAPIRRAWLDRAARLGQPITARTMTETLSGRFETVDETGALVLDGDTGRRAIPAADIFF